MSLRSDHPGWFKAGSTAVHRDALGGKIWSATPCRVVQDSGDELILARWPGVEMLRLTTYIEGMRTGDGQARHQLISDLAASRWKLGRWTWQDTAVLSWFGTDLYFSVHRFMAVTQQACDWYVNFERPCRRTSIGVDACDLMLDLVVDPDLSAYSWKDEDEYEQARQLGMIDDTEHARVDAARQQVLAMIESRQGPFALDFSAWRPDPDWPAPVLPADALTVPTAL